MNRWKEFIYVSALNSVSTIKKHKRENTEDRYKNVYIFFWKSLITPIIVLTVHFSYHSHKIHQYFFESF